MSREEEIQKMKNQALGENLTNVRKKYIDALEPYGEEAINAIAEIVEHNVVSGVREYGLEAIKRIKEGKIKGGAGEK